MSLTRHQSRPQTSVTNSPGLAMPLHPSGTWTQNCGITSQYSATARRWTKIKPLLSAIKTPSTVTTVPLNGTAMPRVVIEAPHSETGMLNNLKGSRFRQSF